MNVNNTGIVCFFIIINITITFQKYYIFELFVIFIYFILKVC